MTARIGSLRTRLLVSACFLAIPGVAHGQTTTVSPGTPRTNSLTMNDDDVLNVLAGAIFEVSGSQAVNISGGSTGAGVRINNDGRIEGVPNSSSNGRAINSSNDDTNRTVTIANTGQIIGGLDAIRINAANATTAGTGTISITNSGSIIATGASTAGPATQSGQGIEVALLGVTLDIDNLAGGTISGSQGIFTTAAMVDITNAGNITGTALVGTQGEAIRTNLVSGAPAGVGSVLRVVNEATGNITGVYGIIGTGPSNTITNRGTISGSNAVTATASQTREGIRINAGIATNQVNVVTLAAGSTTTAGTGTGASGNAVAFGGTLAAGVTMTNTLNIETGAVINGNLTAINNANLNATDKLNLSGAGTQDLVSASSFDELNVLGGSWGIINSQTLRNGATISSGAELRYIDAGASGGSVAGAIVNDGALTMARSSTVNHTGAISGTGSVQVVNTGTLVLAGSNTYSGATVISDGRLRTGQQANSFSANSAVTVTGAGVLDLNDTTEDAGGVGTPIGRDQAIANLSGDGTVRLGQLNAATLTTGSGGGDTTFSGILNQLGNLTKVGTGTLTLSGLNTATGLLSVNGGGVALPGRWAGAVTLGSGTTLSGAGSIAGVLTVGDATVAPGNAGIGTLTTGGLVLSGGSILNYDLGAPGTGDRIQVNGDLTLDGTLNVADVGGFGEGVYRLINYTGTLTDNGLVAGAFPAGADPALATIQTSVASQVNLVYGTPAATTIQFWDGADTVGNGVVDGGSGSWTNASPNWTDANGAGNTAWASAFGVFQGAAGTVTVDDAIVFTGAQFMTDGYEIATGTGTLTTNTALTNIRVDPGVTATISAGIGGTGGLLKNDSGTLILSGANSYGGATSIQGGTVAVLGGSAIPTTSNVTVAAGATLDLRADQAIGDLNGAGAVNLSGGSLTTGALGGNASFTGVISGAGGLTKTGAGTTTLGGANTYTGTTNVAGGTLALDGSVAGAVSVANGATLSGSGSAAGVVTLANGATLAAGGAGAGTFTSGGLVLAAGSTLDFGLGAPNAPGASDRLQVNGDLTLDGTVNVTDLGGFGGGVYRLIDYTGALTDNGLAVGTLPGGVSPTRVTVQTSVAAQVNLVYDTAVPQIQFWDGPNTTANNAVDGGSGSWTNTRTSWTNANGTANIEWGGRFAVFQGAAGTVTVDDAVAFSGMQFITDGYVIAAGTGALSAVEAQTNIRVDPGVTATIGASIGGSGGLLKNDTGTLILTGSNSYAGETVVAGGTLRAGATGALPGGTAVTVASGATLDIAAAQTVGSLAGAGAVTLSGGGLTTGGANTDTAFSGIISGAGGLTKAGTGTLTLSGANTYTGATAVNGGTLALGAGGSIAASSGVTLASGGRFDIAAASAQTVNGLNGAAGTAVVLGANRLTVNNAAANTFAGAISGTGSLVKTGAGTLTLSSVNAHSGGTSVTGGVLAAGAANAFGPGALTVTAPGSASLGTFAQTVASLAGDGAVNLGSATLTVNGSTATTYSGVLSGTGGLTRAGTGTLTLTGASTYTGPTNVTGGLLIVNGSLASAVTVGAQGRLLGTGRVGGLSVAGIVAPGNSIGTLNVTGPLTFSSTSTYQVEVAPNGTSDLIAATGAITINGGTVSVLASGQTGFAGLSTYTILTGASVTGGFANVTSDLAFLTPSLIYNPTSVQLRLIRNDVDFTDIAETANQFAVAAAVGARTSGTLFDAVVTLNAADARNAFDQLSGEVHVAGATLAGRDGHAAGRAMLDRIDSAAGEGLQLWIEGGLGRIEADAGDGFAKVKSQRQAVAGGVEFANGGTRGGVAVRYATSDIEMDARGSDADLTTTAAFAYLGHDTGSLRFAAGLGVAWHKIETDRRIAFGSFTDTLAAKEDGQSYVAFGELAYLAPLGGLRVGPYLGASIVSTTLDGVQETGGAAALTVDKVDKTTTLASYGLRGTGTAGAVTFTADIGGRSYLNDEVATRMFSITGTGEEFVVGAARFGKHALTGRLDASVQAGPAVLGLGLRAETAKDSTSYGVRVSAGIRF